MNKEIPLLVSACLLGAQCKYSGGSNANAFLMKTAAGSTFKVIPVCPECYGGLPIPRVPSEQRNGRVYSKTGQDLTENFLRGSQTALHMAKLFNAKYAVLKERSPSCGSGTIYDGTFTGGLTQGDGIATALLKQNGVAVVGESEAEEFLNRILQNT